MTQSEILALLADAPENEVNLTGLAESIRRRRGVLPFVGAGMSAPFGFPQWGEFLLQLGRHAGRVEDVERSLLAGEYEQAAEDMIQELGSRFQDLVEHHFGDRVLNAARLTGAIRMLPRLVNGPVITTNFDSVLERVFQDSDRPFNRVVWHEKVNSAVRALRNEDRVLLKIHGTWEDPNNRVLTRDEYCRHYGDPDQGVDFNLPLPQLFLLLVTSPLLFLGCSLRQDRTVKIIASITARITDFRHFAVLEMPDPALVGQRRRELAEWNLRPIWYQKGKHEAIASLLEYLIEQTTAASQPSILPQHEPSHSPREVFVGRVAEQEDLRRLIADRALVTVAGSAGSGKTRLVAEVVQSLAMDFKAVWFVPMPAQGAAVEQRVARVLGISGEARLSLRELLVEKLAHDRQLLVLDNCEPVLEECLTLVKTLLNECVNLRIVATSRVVLNEPREFVYWIPPMRSPSPGEAPRVRELRTIDSVTLLVTRVQARMSFDLTEDNAQAVAELCARLEGIPLAIELASAQLSVMGLDEVLELFCRRLDLWKDDRVEEGDRGYRTLRQAIQISVDLLGRYETGERARVLFRRMSIFHRGFTWKAAAAVCRDDGQTEDDVLSLLRILQDESLLQSDDIGGERRFRYLDSIREFATSELASREPAHALAKKHALWFAALAEEAAPELLKNNQEHWLRKLSSEADNLRAAIEWAIGVGDAELALRLTTSLWRAMEILGFYAEGARRLRVALGMPGGTNFPALRSKALSGLSVLAYRTGDFDTAEQSSNESLEIESGRSNPAGVANALNDLGNIAQMRGRYEAAHDLYSRSLTIQRSAGDQRGVAVALHNTGTQARRLGHLDEARASLEESFDLFQSLGNLREAAFPLNGLAVLARIEGRAPLALRLAKQSLAIRSTLNDRKGMAESLRTLAAVHVDEHDLDAARRVGIESAELAIAIRDDRSIAETLELFARLAVAEGRFSQAVSLYATAERARKHLQLPLGPLDLADRERDLAAARSALPKELYEDAWQAGRWTQPTEALQVTCNSEDRPDEAYN